MNPDTVIAYDPEVAQEAVKVIEEAVNTSETSEEVVTENEPISIQEYRALLVLAAQDARTWANQVDSLISKIDAGEKIKGTKLNGTVRNGRLEILRSSLTDVKTAKVIG